MLKLAIKTFAGLETYLDMLNKAVQIGDTELIGHLAGKAAAIFNSYTANASKDTPTGTEGS